jgi:hypothetical protein
MAGAPSQLDLFDYKPQLSKIEGKPEWANRVDYPKMDDPKYKEKMADIRTNGVDSSEYWGSEGNAHELGRDVASSAGWDGVDAADSIAFTLRMNGFHKEADMIQSVFDAKPNNMLGKDYKKDIGVKNFDDTDDYYDLEDEDGNWDWGYGEDGDFEDEDGHQKGRAEESTKLTSMIKKIKK